MIGIFSVTMPRLNGIQNRRELGARGEAMEKSAPAEDKPEVDKPPENDPPGDKPKFALFDKNLTAQQMFDRLGLKPKK
jgi:hypothetical protein